jgi:uncharacterized protein (TIGR02466 family)
MKIQRYPIFPSIITEIECEDYDTIRDDLIKWIYNYHSTNKGITASNRGGWHSEYDFYMCPTFNKFKDYIISNISKSFTIYDTDFKLESMWININQKGDYNVCHDHPKSILSGVFWIKVTKECGNLVLHSGKSFCEYDLLDSVSDEIAEQYNYYSEFQFIPKEGTLIIFPSHIMHDVELNKSDEDRISISFNIYS